MLNSGCLDRLRKIMLPNPGPLELLQICQDQAQLWSPAASVTAGLQSSLQPGL